MADGGNHGPASSLRSSLRLDGWIARTVALIACVGIWSFALVATTAAGGTSSSGAHSADAPPLVPSDLTLAPRLSPAEALQIGSVELTAVAAAQPTATHTAAPTSTATSVPPTVTPVPPTAAPRPRAQAPAAPPATSTPEPRPAVPSIGVGLDTSPTDPYSRRLLDDTNKRRASQGLAPLRENGYLNGIARIRSRDMADHNYFAHVSPVSGENAFDLMDRFRVPYGWAGENLAKNNYPETEAEGVADQALWDSPPHRENILNEHYTDVGIALVVDSTGMKYFTIIFTGPA